MLSSQDDQRTDNALERIFQHVISPFERFIRWESASGIMLMAAAVVAMILANSALAHAFHHLWETPLALSVGDWTLQKSLHHWINDGLMALFFFLVGLEIKNEILAGDLSTPKQAALPMIAALGGMVVPALLFFLVNRGNEFVVGWGIPMATDIAFAVGVMTLLGARVPKALLMFLVALAIADDLGAVVVIAVFYTDDLHTGALLLAAGLLALMAVLNAANVRSSVPYFILGGLLWYAVLQSGVHATVAGVLTAFMIPTSSRFSQASFSKQVRELLDRFDRENQSKNSPSALLANKSQLHMLETLQNGLHAIQPPLIRLEHMLALPVAFLIVPLFALANAGVTIQFDELASSFSHPVVVGILLGLVVGKPLGITLFTWLAVRVNLARLPDGVHMGHVFGAGLIAGIGFTMSIFIDGLSFEQQPHIMDLAKMAILSASILAAVLGAAWFMLTAQPAQRTSTQAEAEAEG
ncbi:MAG: Na+/H+ antiporter NhaA [Pseudomonadota bacterium]